MWVRPGESGPSISTSRVYKWFLDTYTYADFYADAYTNVHSDTHTYFYTHADSNAYSPT